MSSAREADWQCGSPGVKCTEVTFLKAKSVPSGEVNLQVRRATQPRIAADIGSLRNPELYCDADCFLGLPEAEWAEWYA